MYLRETFGERERRKELMWIERWRERQTRLLAICTGLCNNVSELSRLLEQCLFDAEQSLQDSLRWLVSQRLIAYSKVIFTYVVKEVFADDNDNSRGVRGTQLGRAALASSLPPEIALQVFMDLEKSSRGLILDSELHLLYLVTPLNNNAIWNHYMDWNVFYEIWSKLPRKLKRVGSTVGVREHFFLERIQGRFGADTSALQVHLRFISALALLDLINECPIEQVASKFNINRGALQSLQQQAATYACMVVAFCDRLGWSYFKSILDGFSERIAFGVRKNLTDLVRIPGIDASRARAFHAANVTTVASLANCTAADVVKVLRTAVPFTKSSGNDLDYNRWLRGERLMSDTEAAELLIERAKNEVFTSLREVGLFTDSQITLLLKKSSKQKYNDTNDDIANRDCNRQKEREEQINEPTQSCDTASGDNGSTNDTVPELDLERTNISNISSKEVRNLTHQMRRCSLVNVKPFVEANDNDSTNIGTEATSINGGLKLSNKTASETATANSYSADSTAITCDSDVNKALSTDHNRNENNHCEIGNLSPIVATSANSCNKSIRCSTDKMNTSIEKQNEESTSSSDAKYSESKFDTSNLADTTTDSFLAAVNTQLVGDSAVCQQLSSTVLATPVREEELCEASTSSKDQSNCDLFTSFLEEAEVKSNHNTSKTKERISCLGSPLSSVVKRYNSEDKNLSYVHDRSCDLFDPTYSSQSPEAVALKRVRDIKTAYSPITPSTRSPFMKQPRYSEPCKTAGGTPQASSSSLINFTIGSLPSRILDVCSSVEQWNNFIDASREWKEIGFSLAFDSNSSSSSNDNYNCKELIGISLCPPDGSPAFISLNDSLVYGEDDEEAQYPSFTPLDSISILERVRILETLLHSKQPKYVFNILKFSRQLFRAPFDYCTAEHINNFKCLQMLSFLANYRSSDGPCHSLRELLKRLPPNLKLDIINYRSARIQACIDAFLCMKLFPYLYSVAIQRTSKYSVELELKAVRLLAKMEAAGIPFSTALAKQMSDSIKKELSSLESRAYEICGVAFNFESPSEIANVLFVRMKLPLVDSVSKTAKKHFSTNKAVLEKLAVKYEIAEIILKWRKMNTALSLSLNTLLKFSNAENRIHSLFFPYTLTGRVQSTNPNVQNVQKNEVINGLSVRSLFEASDGMTFISADYKQLEMRILAHFCADPNLKRLFYSKYDFFQTMVNHWNDNPSLKIKIDRQKVKQLCYGLIYGMGAATLSEQLSVSKTDAKSMIDAFFKQFPKVRIWIDEIVQQCHAEEVETLLGRKCCFQEMFGIQKSSESRADRRAVNYVIQGSASEVFKMALVNIEERLKGSIFLRYYFRFELDARIVMQIHDEVIVEARNQDVEEVTELIKESMCSKNFGLTIPLDVKISRGDCWGKMEEMSSSS
uniref:DNA-directed DNA polymerase n=1 Tax=Syphacia muris TaxID=451379 RepID=A0A158R5I3_9BILA